MVNYAFPMKDSLCALELIHIKIHYGDTHKSIFWFRRTVMSHFVLILVYHKLEEMATRHGTYLVGLLFLCNIMAGLQYI